MQAAGCASTRLQQPRTPRPAAAGTVLAWGLPHMPDTHGALALTRPPRAAQVTGILTGSIPLIGRSLDSDVIVEPVRAPLIPGMMDVKAAAKAAGGLQGWWLALW
jgi:hypothetical protein